MTAKEQIAALDEALEGLQAECAFVGGGVPALLVTDPTVVDGFVQPEPFAEPRKAKIPSRFREVAATRDERSAR